MKTDLRLGALLTLLTIGLAAQAQQRFQPLSADLALTYTVERAKIVSGNCLCFWMQGGSMNAGFPIFRGLSMAANVTGEHSSGITSGVELSRISFVAGPRYTLNTGRWTNRWLRSRHPASIFGEALFGGVHAFDGVFPTRSGLTSSANSVAMQFGGGVNIVLVKKLGLRAVEVDYLRTTLPNNGNSTQNDLRLAIGVTYHVGRGESGK
jgi:hypothetical protein